MLIAVSRRNGPQLRLNHQWAKSRVRDEQREKKRKSAVQASGQTMDESLRFLSKTFDLLNEGDVFDTRTDEVKSIVDFKHPEELKVSQSAPYKW